MACVCAGTPSAIATISLSPSTPTMSIQGLDPYLARQYLLHHAYSPLVSVQSSHSADTRIQNAVRHQEGFSTLLILEPYGNNAKYSVTNQAFKITNTLLITRSYPSFPIRFQLCLVEQLSVLQASESKLNLNKLRQLFSASSLEGLMQHIASEDDALNDLYLEFFAKVISSNRIVPFETFNHPVCQIFVIDFHTDTLASLRQTIVDFRNYNFPKYFQIDDLLMHVFILYDPNVASEVDITTFQSDIRRQLSIQSSPIAVIQLDDEAPLITLSKHENSTIEEDLQRLSLENAKVQENLIQIPHSLDSTIKQKLYEFINKHLIPHMTEKVRHWDDSILAPKKSFTGRFFSVSKKLFNNENNSSGSGQSSTSFNHQGNYYHKTSVEQTIRKLADWSLILKDFKYAYSTYDLIKKEYNNDRAWAYVASTQEMCVVSLLLAQTQQSIQITPPDKNTLRKIKHDIVEPYLDSLAYTYKSRLNIKTYGIRASLVVIELLLCMCNAYNISWWWSDLIERYLCKCVADFESTTSNSASDVQVIRALLYERLGYCLGNCVYSSLPSTSISVKDAKSEESKEGFYRNTNKMEPSSVSMGLKRERQASLWYLLSIKEWALLKNYKQAAHLLHNIESCFTIDRLTNEWYDRPDVLLGCIKRQMEIVGIKEEVVES